MEQRATAAACQAPIIRKRWKDHVGNKNRKEGERSAAWFAARFWDVDENDVAHARNSACSSSAFKP